MREGEQPEQTTSNLPLNQTLRADTVLDYLPSGWEGRGSETRKRGAGLHEDAFMSSFQLFGGTRVSILPLAFLWLIWRGVCGQVRRSKEIVGGGLAGVGGEGEVMRDGIVW